MSRAAAQAMRDLADCFEEEGIANMEHPLSPLMGMMAAAHRKAADRIEARAAELEAKVAPQLGDVQFHPKGKPGR